MAGAGGHIHGHGAAFRHDALFYDGDAEFLAGTVPFLADGIESGEPALVATDERKIRLLEAELGEGADEVTFLDMAKIGQNPARIIPIWRDFVDENVGADEAARGIGEPVWFGRSEPEITECQRHEALLNLAFDGGRPWSLLCPYDSQRLPDAILEEACRSHPVVAENGRERASQAYIPEAALHPFTGELVAPPGDAETVHFAAGGIGSVRDFVGDRASRAGLPVQRTADLVLAISELATNSVRYGNGGGSARVWVERSTFLCEVRDAGVITEPLVGRVTPTPEQFGGRGLWIVNQLCDLAQIRSSGGGSHVRVHMRLGGADAPSPRRRGEVPVADPRP